MAGVVAHPSACSGFVTTMLSVCELSLDEMRCTMLCWTSESCWKAGSVLSSSISALELL